MTNEELTKIKAIMKKIFCISAAIYALFVFVLFYFCAKFLTPVQLVSIVIFTPMVVGFVILGVYKLKHPPVLDQSEENFEDESETED